MQCAGRHLHLCSFIYVLSHLIALAENVDYSSHNKLVIDSCCLEHKSFSVLFGVRSVRRGSRRLRIILLPCPGSSDNFSITLQQAGTNVVWFFYCTGYQGQRLSVSRTQERMKCNITLDNAAASFIIQFKDICGIWK